jgi:hypothetical protein
VNRKRIETVLVLGLFVNFDPHGFEKELKRTA